MTLLRFGRLEVTIESPGSAGARSDAERRGGSIDGSRASLAGRLDDSATQLGQLLGQLPEGPVTLDTAGIWFVNSIGMREWTRLVRGLRARGSQVTLDRVADVLMTQMNMVSELAGSVAITSFHAQYLCNQCGGEHTQLVEVAPHAQALRMLSPPKLPCPECGAPMELGDFPERYLSIFKR